MSGALTRLSDGVNFIVERCVIVLAAILTVLTTTGIVYRYILNKPLMWLQETVVLVFIWTMFLAISVAFKRQEHISLGFLINSVPPGAKRVIRIVINLAIIFFLYIAITEGSEIVKSTKAQQYQTIDVSIAWFYASFPFGAAVSILHLADHIINLVIGKTKETENEQENANLL